MSETAQTSGDLLFPLNRHYAAQGLPLPALRPLDGAAMPQPFRSLLVHERDMTPTLAAYFGDEIALTVLQSRRLKDLYSREVILSTAHGGLPVEYGSIDIYVDNFAPEPRERILRNRLPLGAILAFFQVPHISAPRGYFTLPSDALLTRHFGLSKPAMLYGRRNRLSTPDGRTLAEIVEILTPHAESYAAAQAQQQQQ